MFTTELVLMTAGLTIAFFSQGHRRTLFHAAIALFLIALILGSVSLVIGGIAILGMGMIEGSLTNESWLRGKVYATTSVLLLAAVTLPAMRGASNHQAAQQPIDAAASPAISNLLSIDQQQLAELVAENRDVVNGLAQEFLGDARRRVVEVARQSEGLDVETTIDFKAPANLLNAAMNKHLVHSDQDTVHESINQITNGRLKVHAALNEAQTCNQCHEVGATPLHAELNYEWKVGDQDASGERSIVPMDPELMVLAN
jgi:hypothetical protein